MASSFFTAHSWFKYFLNLLLFEHLILFCQTRGSIELPHSAPSPNPTDFNQVIYKKFTFLTEENFEENTNNSGFNGHLVFFGARWCGHSRQFNSTFKQLADVVMRGDLDRTPKMSFYLIQNPKDDKLHSKFRVTGFPTLIYLSNRKYWTFQGDRKLEAIIVWLEEIFSDQGKEGTPYPTENPSLWSELHEIWRDMKYTFRSNLKHHPVYTWIGFAIVVGSTGSVLVVFAMLIYDSCVIGDSINEDEIEDPIDPDKKDK